MPVEGVEGGASHAAFIAELEADNRRMRRRDLLLRLVSVALVVWVGVPADHWRSPKLGETLAFVTGVALVQLFLLLGWLQRVAERWVKNGALQVCVIGLEMLVVIVSCEAAYSLSGRLWR